MKKALTTPATKKSNTNNWNVMVYMAADNSLSEECVFSLKEMQRVGAADGVNVIAQFHSSAKDTAPRRYSIRKLDPGAGQQTTTTPIGDDDGKLEAGAKEVSLPKKSSQPLATQQPAADQAAARALTKEQLLSASNPAVLVEFLASSIATQPAPDAHQLVILSGHGSGAVGAFLKSNNPAASLAVSDLHKVFQTIRQKLQRNIDIVLMDSCLMSMAEVAHELYGKAHLLIGAEGFELNTGWPYHRILQVLNKASQQGTDARTLACQMVSKYVLYYSDYDVAGVSVDQAVCDLKRSPALVKAVKALKEALSEGIKQGAILDAVLLAHWRAQSYNAEQYVDLWDFCDQLERSCQDKTILAACQHVKVVIAGDPQQKISPFVLRSCFSGAAFQHSHGVSIYFPWAADTQHVVKFKELVEYKKLKFPRQTGWGDFIEEYLRASRGEIRNLKEHQRQGDKLRCFIPTDETRVEVRILDPGSKGGSAIAARVKNPPVEFFRETCDDKLALD